MDSQAGKLDQQIILKSVAESNVSGEMTKTVAIVATVWAHVISQKGSEAFETARMNARDNIRVLIRYRTDVTDKWQFVWEGQTYNVKNVDRSQRRKGQLWMTAECVGAL